MSRLGRIPIAVPAGVTVATKDGVVTVKGPKGQLDWRLPADIDVAPPEGGRVRVTSRVDDRRHSAQHGLTRALVANMVVGVTKGYERRLSLVGVGYGAKKDGATLVLTVGFANAMKLLIPKGVDVEVGDKGLSFVVRGSDKQMVGEFAARARRVRPPEPYKGKGIRYDNEVVRRKAGKTLVAGGGGGAK